MNNIIAGVITTLVSTICIFILEKISCRFQNDLRILGIRRVKTFLSVAIIQCRITLYQLDAYLIIIMLLIWLEKPVYVVRILIVSYVFLTAHFTYKNIKKHKEMIDSPPESICIRLYGCFLLWGIWLIGSIFLIVEYVRNFNICDLIGLAAVLILWTILIIFKPENKIYFSEHEFFVLFDKSSNWNIKMCAKTISKQGEWVKGRINNEDGKEIYIKWENVTQITPMGKSIEWCIHSINKQENS